VSLGASFSVATATCSQLYTHAEQQKSRVTDTEQQQKGCLVLLADWGTRLGLARNPLTNKHGTPAKDAV
jgi:hypothetical protein